MPADELAVRATDDSDPLVHQAVKELLEVLGRSEDAQSPPQPTFRLTLELGGEGAESLKSLPHSDQALSD